MKPLLGIDPTHRHDMEFGGAVFTLAPIESVTWERLNHRWLSMYRDAMRRAIREASAGKDPNEPIPETVWLPIIMRDFTFKEEAVEVFVEMARYSVKGHKGFVTKKGEVPFTTDARGLASEETLRYYLFVPGLLDAIHVAVHKLCTLGDEAKKDSAQPS